MMKTKRFLSLLLTLLLLAPAFAGCGEKTPPDIPAPAPDTTTDAPASGETVTTEPETTVLDAVPVLDFGGASFRTIAQPGMMDFYTEEETGEIVNDAVFARNRAAEERFSIVIEPTREENYNMISSIITAAVQSGSDDFDLVLGQMYKTGQDALRGLFANWNTIPYVQLDNPWYTKNVQDASVKDLLYMIESDLVLSYAAQTWMLLYNKTKAADYGMTEDLYQTVRDGAWTLDHLIELTEGAYDDLDGDGVRGPNDFFGFGSTPNGCMLAAFLYACDTRLVTLDADANVTQQLGDERSIDLLNRLAVLFTTSPGTWMKGDAKTRVDMFPRGNYLFQPMYAGDLLGLMREFSDDFGVLPLPKYDAEQKEYYTVVDGGANILSVLKTAEHRDMIGAVTEVMSAESYRTVIPAYCDSALSMKGVRDRDSSEMMRLILDSRAIDFGYLYDGWNGWVMKLPDMITRPQTIASTFKKGSAAIQKTYENMVEKLIAGAE